MNANWMRAIAAAASVVSTLCLVTIVSAEPNGVTAMGSARQAQSGRGSLSRADVDKLLVQARGAIAAGNMDQAEALVAKAESVQVRYPLFHIGATPASVRRELNNAKQKDRYAPQPPSDNVGDTRAALNQYTKPPASLPADPFAERPMRMPAGIASQPTPPSMPNEDGMNPPVVPALHSHPVGSRENVVEQASAEFGGMLPDAPLPPGLASAGDSGRPLPAMLPSGRIATMPAPAQGPNLAVPNSPKAEAQQLLREAREALIVGNLELADAKAREATAIGVPESAFLPHEDRPSVVSWDVERARSNEQMAVPAVDTQVVSDDRYAAQPQLNPAMDSTRNVPAGAQPASMPGMRFAQLPEPIELPSDNGTPFGDESQYNEPQSVESRFTSPIASPISPMATAGPPSDENESAAPAPPENKAAQLLIDGETALEQHDRETAARLFGQAYVLRDLLTARQQQALKERLQMLASASASEKSTLPKPSSLIDAAAEGEQALARQLSAEVGKKQSEARRLREKDPKTALKMLQDTRKQVADSKLSEAYRNQLLRRVDITLDETEKFIKDHGAEIEFDQKNDAVMAEVNRNKEVKIKVQQKVAEMVDEFNRLRDEQRYYEMEVVAQRLIEMAPDEPVAQQVWQNAKFIRRTIMNSSLADRKESAIWNALNDVEEASVQNVGDNREMVYDQKRWESLVKNRTNPDQESRRSERELEIERRLRTPVMLRYEETPLSEVMQGLSELAGVNIHLDPRGLSQEGVETSTPITINLSKEISLKSALNLVLEPLHLSYMIKDEVLKVTSEQLRDGDVFPKTYNVADLVIPIPNFVPNNNIGLQGLINEAQNSIAASRGPVGMPGASVLVNEAPNGQNMPGQNVLAQQFGAGGGAGANSTIPMGNGPGGMGGAASADFDSLIDLIVSTVASETWAENGGGEAEIRPFPTNLSLVISQTQAVHEEIADLLEQLRRLQDLQVTIEVRFIRLNDSFFERIGVDFDLNIEDRTAGTEGLVPGVSFEPTVNGRPTSTVVGLQFPVAPTNPFPNYTSDLDVPFRQSSFDLARPVIGGAGATNPATFGFAILSEIEAFFLIEAAQGDTRTNVLNAPKVTLFNGQQAFVADAVSRPFVIGVIPVVGEFAAAQQPVIVVLNEGTLMSIQAVVSNDRRYVRLTVVPFFTQVGNVDTFTFEGSNSSSSSSSSSDDDEDGNNEAEEEDEEEFSSGVTVQLPSFQFVAVVTTVSVPDGGTVLLGGIKRLSEGRNEFGIPLLSKVPYVNRLFRNVGIGRTTDSLMMMVTPRIIIQEEEEERLGITAVP